MPRMTALAGLMLIVVACGGTPSGASISTAGPSTTATTAPSTASSPTTPPATPSPSPSKSAGYSTRVFTTPIEFVVPSFVPAEPTEESDHFMTWIAADDTVAIRFLQPVVLYAPGSGATGPVPADYLPYLLGQADHGAAFADRVDTTVDGHAATVVTATTSQSIDGSLGCPGTRIDPGECFGLQPQFSLRLAVVTTDAGPLLIWLRSGADALADVAAAKDRFDEVLAGVRFADR